MLTEREEILLTNRNDDIIYTFRNAFSQLSYIVNPDVPMREMHNSKSSSKYALSYCSQESFLLSNSIFDSEFDLNASLISDSSNMSSDDLSVNATVQYNNFSSNSDDHFSIPNSDSDCFDSSFFSDSCCFLL